jgi:phosphatidylcholine synthase
MAKSFTKPTEINRTQLNSGQMVDRRILAWGVHLYTATGLIAAAAIAVLIIRGDDASYRLALLLMIVATIIDSTDGWLARLVDVRKWAPSINGRTLDDITDFHTYTSLPLLLIWHAGLLTGASALVLVFALVASAYGFSQTSAKTSDGFFMGFPSYWNAIAFYLYFMKLPVVIAACAVFFFAVMTFIPARYLYPMAGGPLRRLTSVLACLWGAVLIMVLTGTIKHEQRVVWMSFAFPIYYLVISWWITLRSRE